MLTAVTDVRGQPPTDMLPPRNQLLTAPQMDARKAVLRGDEGSSQSDAVGPGEAQQQLSGERVPCHAPHEARRGSTHYLPWALTTAEGWIRTACGDNVQC